MVSSAGFSRIAKFNTDGRLQTYWGTFGDAPGSADNLHAFAIDDAGNTISPTPGTTASRSFRRARMRTRPA